MTRSKSGLNEGHDLLANTLKRVDERVDDEGFIFSPSSDDSLNVDSSSQTFASAPCSQQSVEPTISPYRLSSQQSFSDEFRVSILVKAIEQKPDLYTFMRSLLQT